MRPWADTTCKVFACEPHYKLRPCQECSLSFHNFRNYSVCHPFVNLPNRLDHLQCIVQYVHLPLENCGPKRRFRGARAAQNTNDAPHDCLEHGQLAGIEKQF